MADFRTLHFCELSPSSTKEEVSQGDETFLAGFLGKLLDHITHSTETSALDLDFDGILKNLRTVEETSFNLSQTVRNLNRAIFEKLWREFGSTKLLQAAIMSEDMATRNYNRACRRLHDIPAALLQKQQSSSSLGG